jgi:N-acetylglucosamine-6-sulfatase
MTPSKTRSIDSLRQRQLQTLWSLDHSVGQILNTLEQLQLADSTIVIYLSDNGLLWGEFGLESKSCAYEPSIRVPMAIRPPPGLVAPRIDDHLVANIDIAPTIRELAQLPTSPGEDGSSLTSLLASPETDWRKHLLIEGFRTTESRVGFRAIHRGDAILIKNEGDIDELYDLANDPFQTNNQALNDSDSPLYKSLQIALAQLEKTIPTQQIVSAAQHARARKNITSWKAALRKCRISKHPSLCNFPRVWNRLFRRNR